MADRMMQPLGGSLSRGVVILAGRWAIGSAGAVGTKTCGEGMTLSRTGTGAYTITLSDTFYELCSAQVSVNTTTPASQGCIVKPGTYTRASKTYTFTTFSADTSAAADPVNGEIHVALFLKNASS